MITQHDSCAIFGLIKTCAGNIFLYTHTIAYRNTNLFTLYFWQFWHTRTILPWRVLRHLTAHATALDNTRIMSSRPCHMDLP